MRVLLLGAPGAGKGTQAKILADSIGVPHIASGDLFRNHQAEGTDLGKLAKSYMDAGELVPDEVVIQMVLDRIGQTDAETGYILDGFPRTVPQAEALDRALASQNGVLDSVELIEVAVEDLTRRLSGRWSCGQCQRPYHEISARPTELWVCDDCGVDLQQRADDRPESVVRRLEVYQIQTAPLVQYYEKQGKLTRIEGQNSIGQVSHDLLKAIGRERELTGKTEKIV